MAFDRWGYAFNGAFSSPSHLEARAGVYVVWCRRGEHWSAIAVGEASDVRERLEDHERKSCWERYCRGGVLRYSVHYMPGARQRERRVVEAAIRNAVRPPCGEH
jgi:hypothetical protein